MTKKQKADVLFAILDCAPMGNSRSNFKRYAERGDVSAFWTFYQKSITARHDVKRNVEKAGEISFEMVRPAMETIYKLPTTD